MTNFRLQIDHDLTADLPDGQPCPPFIVDNVVWRIVRRFPGATIWRRIHLIDEQTLDTDRRCGDERQ
jgi:hypothetical protein